MSSIRRTRASDHPSIRETAWMGTTCTDRTGGIWPACVLGLIGVPTFTGLAAWMTTTERLFVLVVVVLPVMLARLFALLVLNGLRLLRVHDRAEHCLSVSVATTE